MTSFPELRTQNLWEIPLKHFCSRPTQMRLNFSVQICNSVPTYSVFPQFPNRVSVDKDNLHILLAAGEVALSTCLPVQSERLPHIPNSFYRKTTETDRKYPKRFRKFVEGVS